MFPMYDPVCVLIETPFSRWKIGDKRDFLNCERPVPSLDVGKRGVSKDKVFVRKFRIEWYSEFKWLCGSVYLKKLFCVSCLIVGVKSGVWNKRGFNNFGNVTRGCRKHEASWEHIRCALMFAELRKKLNTTEDSFTEYSRLYIKQFNDNVLLNRRFMQLPIRAAVYLGRQELAFRGHEEQDNRGNFKELLDMIISVSPADIQEHYKKISPIFPATSKSIQNELMDCISDYIDQYVDKEIAECNYFSIQVDDSTDIAQKSQCSIIIRYVNSTGKLVERFLGFFDVSSDRTADALFNLVRKRIEKYGYRSKLVAQSFDGASVMAGQVNGLQSKIKNQAPQAVFVHCAAHRLNLVLQQSCNNISKCRIFFANVTGIPPFFHHSAKITRLKRKTLTSVSICETSNSNIVKLINNEWNSMKQVFMDIINDRTSDQTSVRQSLSFLNMFNDFEFALLISIFSEIFSITDVLSEMLQKRSLNIHSCISQIKNTQKLLNEERNERNFQKILELSSIKVTVRDGQIAEEIFENYKVLYYEILDTISGQIDIRFRDLHNIHFVDLMDTMRFEEYSRNFPTEAFNNLNNNCYLNIFSLLRLKNELYFIYNDEQYRNIELDQILAALHENRDILKEVYKLFCLIVTIPSASVSVERSFSCSRRIKTYLRNSSEDRPTNFAKISIEKGLLHQLISAEPFYDDIIDKFAALRDRSIHLIFKKYINMGLGTLPVDSSGIDNLDLSMDVLKRPIKTYGKKVRVSPINSPDDLSQDPAPSTSHCYMETKNFASPLSDLSLRDYGTTEIKTEIKIEEILPPKYPKITQSSEHDEETPLTAELKHEGNVHMSPINSPDDLSRDPAPSTSHCYMESKNFDSPFSDSSFCDYDTTEIKTEIKIEEEEIVLPKYPDNCNQSLEHDEESPPYAKLKDELRRLSDLCAKQKQMLEQSTEIRPQIKIENQHLTQVQALNNIPSEVNATENCATKSSHLIKKQISKRRRSTFKKTQAPAPAGSLQFTLNFSSKNTYEYIKRARDFRLNVNGFSAGFRKISKTHREQYHTC